HRRELVRLEPLLDIRRRRVVARSACAPALELVRRQERHVAHHVGRHRYGGLRRGLGRRPRFLAAEKATRYPAQEHERGNDAGSLTRSEGHKIAREKTRSNVGVAQKKEQGRSTER